MKHVGMLILFITLIALAAGCDQDALDVSRYDLAFPNEAPVISEVDQATAYADGTIRTDRVTLNWTEYTKSDFLVYQILRRPAASVAPYAIVGSVNDMAVTSFTDSNLTISSGDIEYSYVIATMLKNGAAKVDTIDIKTPMWSAPTNIVVNVQQATSCILTWDDNCESEEFYRIYEYDDDYEFGAVPQDSTDVDADVTHASFNNVDNTNAYTIVAFNDFEDPTPETSKRYFSSTFNQPNIVDMMQLMGTHDLLMYWNDNSNTETHFQIQRNVDGAGWPITDTYFATLDMNETEFVDEDLNVGSFYQYRIRGYNDEQDITTGWSYSPTRTIRTFEIYTSFEDGDVPGDFDLGGDSDWMVVANDDYEEDDYIFQAGPITHEEETYFEWTTDDLTVSHTISFRLKVSSEWGSDYLRFYIDDVQQGEWSGNQNWTSRSYSVGSGEHVLRWSYEKDDYDHSIDSDDTAWIDEINMW